ncbi:MAG: class I SAM-dependent methyltransferase, partial [Clostridia bacterium]|nr:class I SAM-dependent methyltransferase [Clostridia bacterium]
RNPQYREKFDFACARAVANLPALSEYCLPFVKKGGSFIALKGPNAQEETAAAENALKLLGGGKPEIICESLPGNDKRSIIFIKKISQTPPKYPRIGAKISKQPL